MPNIRTANKNRKRIAAAAIARRKLAEQTPVKAAKPVKAAI